MHFWKKGMTRRWKHNLSVLIFIVPSRTFMLSWLTQNYQTTRCFDSSVLERSCSFSIDCWFFHNYHLSTSAGFCCNPVQCSLGWPCVNEEVAANNPFQPHPFSDSVITKQCLWGVRVYSAPHTTPPVRRCKKLGAGRSGRADMNWLKACSISYGIKLCI